MYSFIIFMTLVVEPKVSWLPRLYTANRQLNFFVLIASVCLFWSFLGLKIQNKFINFVAGSTFAVLLIHDDPLVRGVVWSKIAHAASHGMSRYLFFWAGMTIIAVYAACVVIDKICKFLFIKRFWRLCNENY